MGAAAGVGGSGGGVLATPSMEKSVSCDDGKEGGGAVAFEAGAVANGAVGNGKAAGDANAGSSGAGFQEAQWVLWQVIDSAFPAGGFNHSLGLEATLRAGAAPTPAHLEGAVRGLVANAAALNVPLLLEAFDACHEAGSVDASARTLAASSVAVALSACNAVALAAAAAQGRSVLRAVEAAFGGAAGGLGEGVRALVTAFDAAGAPAPHSAIVLGFVLGAAGVGRAQAARAPVFAALRDALAAATRLNAVGPLAAARLHAKLAPAAEALTAEAVKDDAARRAKGVPLERRAALAAPLLDVLQGGHEQQFIKLFCS